MYGLAFIMGKWFLTDNSATVGRILRIFLADSHEISILMKLWKISPLKCLRGRGRKLRITGIGIWANFGLILFKFSVFLRAFFFLWGHHHETLTLRVQSAMLGEHFSQKLTLAHPYNPIFWPKRQDMPKPPKKIKKLFLLGASRNWSSNLFTAEFPHYNSDLVQRVS